MDWQIWKRVGNDLVTYSDDSLKLRRTQLHDNCWKRCRIGKANSSIWLRWRCYSTRDGSPVTSCHIVGTSVWENKIKCTGLILDVGWIAGYHRFEAIQCAYSTYLLLMVTMMIKTNDVLGNIWHARGMLIYKCWGHRCVAKRILRSVIEVFTDDSLGISCGGGKEPIYEFNTKLECRNIEQRNEVIHLVRSILLIFVHVDISHYA